MHFTPKDQIVLLAGLESDEARRGYLWSLPELKVNLERLMLAGLVDGEALARPSGVAAARSLHHITLDDLVAEHLAQASPSPSAGDEADSAASS